MLQINQICLSPVLAAVIGALLTLMAATSPSLAQSNDVQTNTVKDWVVRCVERDGLPPCDAVQSISSNDTGERVMLTSVAYLGDEGQVGIQIWVQTGVIVSAGALVEVDEAEAVLPELTFTRCESDGCFLEAVINEGELSPLKKGTNAAVAVLASSGQPRIVGMSLSGFTQAFQQVKDANTEWFKTQ